MSDLRPALLILDLDETLIHSSEKIPAKSIRPPDFQVGPFGVFCRPFLKEFLSTVSQIFQLAIWSSASSSYVAEIAARIVPPEIPLAFCWSGEQCTQKYHPEKQSFYWLKNLKKVSRNGFELNRILIVDDSPEKVHRNYGNAIYVQPFLGALDDVELKLLSLYLPSLQQEPDLRKIEKRNWRTRTLASEVNN